MRLAIILINLLALGVLGLVSSLQGPFPAVGWPVDASTIVAGTLVFFACVTGILVARLSRAHERAASAAAWLRRTNAELERLIEKRTQSLSEKVAELELARTEAVEANATKSRFLATMSHELRTPLNAILGFSELIRREMFGPAGDGRYVEYAGHIHQSGSHLLSLIGEILDLSKIEAGKVELYCEPLSVAEIIAEARRLSGARSCEDGRTIGVTVEGGLPPLNADRRATVQMVLNLLSNAMKFTPAPGAITVSASAAADGGISIAVRDTGVGIAKEDIAKALTVYGQVTNNEVRTYQGTGLGLPIVKAMMELHGGVLLLESEPGQGTTATLRFPPERSLRGDEGSLAA